MYSLRNMIDKRNNEFNRFDGNTNSSMANKEFIPYEKYITNKNLDNEGLYNIHVKTGERISKNLERLYEEEKQSKEKNNENNIEEKREEIVKKIKDLTSKFFNQRIKENKRIIKEINKNPKTKIDLRTIEKYEKLRNTNNSDTYDTYKVCKHYINNDIDLLKNPTQLTETELKCGIFNLPDSNDKIKESQGIIEKLKEKIKNYDSNNKSIQNEQLSKLYIQRLKELITKFEHITADEMKNSDDYMRKLNEIYAIQGDGEISDIYDNNDNKKRYYKYGAQLLKLFNTKLSENIKDSDLKIALNKLDNLQPQENNNEDKFKKFFTGEGLDGFYEKFLKKETHILRQVPLKLGNAEVISMDNNMKQKGINEQIEKDQKNIQNLVDLYNVDKKEEKEGDEKDFFDLYNYIFTDINSFKENYEEILKGINKGDTSSLDDNNFKKINMIAKPDRYNLYCLFMFYAFKNEKIADNFEIGNVQGSGNYQSLSDIFIDKVLYLKNKNQGGRKKKRTNKKKKTKKGNKKSKRKTRKVKK